MRRNEGGLKVLAVLVLVRENGGQEREAQRRR